jgi:hypothetical protein
MKRTYRVCYPAKEANKEKARTKIENTFNSYESLKYLGVKDGHHEFLMETTVANHYGIYNMNNSRDYVQLKSFSA